VTQHVHRSRERNWHRRKKNNARRGLAVLRNELKVERNVTCPSNRSHDSPCQRAYLRGSGCQGFSRTAVCRPFKVMNTALLRFLRVFASYHILNSQLMSRRNVFVVKSACRCVVSRFHCCKRPSLRAIGWWSHVHAAGGGAPTVGSLRVPSPNFAGVLSTASLTKDSHTKCKCRAARLPGFKLALLSTASQPYQKTTFISFTQLKRTIRWLLPSLVLFYSLLHTRSQLRPSPSSFFTPKTNNRFSCLYTTTTHLTLSITSVSQFSIQLTRHCPQLRP
jgi:hypothetical protein